MWIRVKTTEGAKNVSAWKGYSQVKDVVPAVDGLGDGRRNQKGRTLTSLPALQLLVLAEDLTGSSKGQHAHWSWTANLAADNVGLWTKKNCSVPNS